MRVLLRGSGAWRVVPAFAAAIGLTTSSGAQELNLPRNAITLAAQAQRPGREVTVDELQRLALERNLDILATRQEIAAAKGLLTQSRLRPNPGVDFTVGTGRPLGSAGEREIAVGYAHTFELGGKRAQRIEVGRVGVEIAEFQVADRERLLIADLKVRYAEALAAARNLEMLAELSELTTRTYRVAQQRVSEGEAAPVERALLQVEVGRLTADRLLAASAGARAAGALKLAAGLDPQDLLSFRGNLTAARASLSLDAAIATALAQRPDLQAARAEERRAEADHRLARAGRTPDVLGLVRYAQTDSRFDQFGTTAAGQIVPVLDRDHTITVGVSVPLAFANRNQGNIEAALAQRQGAVLRRQFLEESVRTEVRAAYAQYVATSQALAAFDQDVVKQAQEGATIIRASYDLGEVQLLDLLQEQRRFLETQKAYTEILKEHYVARAALEAAISAELR